MDTEWWNKFYQEFHDKISIVDLQKLCQSIEHNHDYHNYCNEHNDINRVCIFCNKINKCDKCEYKFIKSRIDDDSQLTRYYKCVICQHETTNNEGIFR